MNNEVLTLIIKDLQLSTKSFPAFAAGLANAGVLSFTTDVATGHTLYRFGQGETLLFPGENNRAIDAAFAENATRVVLITHQQGKLTFPEFMDGIAAAGVRFFECTLTGTKRVTYYGLGGNYVEEIPGIPVS